MHKIKVTVSNPNRNDHKTREPLRYDKYINVKNAKDHTQAKIKARDFVRDRGYRAHQTDHIEEALNVSQRLKRRMVFKRNKAKIARGRKLAKLRMASPARLKGRANKEARSVLFKRLSGGKSKSSIAIGSREAIEKKLESKKGAIARLSQKLFLKAKKREIARRQKRHMKESLQEKLTGKHSMGDWVKDFQNSDAPQFRGKTPQERAKMAIAAKQKASNKEGERETRVSGKADEKKGQKNSYDVTEGKRGLWDNIHAKRKRIKAGSGERMRKPGSEGAPTNQDFKDASEGVQSFKGFLEATYKGKEVPLNKPMAGDVKKSKVFVDPDGDGKAQKVNFGDKKMSIKKNIKSRKKSYCARSAGIKGGGNDKSKANYWSRKAWDC